MRSITEPTAPQSRASSRIQARLTRLICFDRHNRFDHHDFRVIAAGTSTVWALDGKVARRALSSAGAVVIRSASAKLPPPDVFHFRHRFFPPTKGFAAACFIHEATWCSSRSSTDASSTPRVDLPIPIGVTGGSGLISVPRMNISFT